MAHPLDPAFETSAQPHFATSAKPRRARALEPHQCLNPRESPDIDGNPSEHERRRRHRKSCK
jgi:hypothetical protein